MENSKYKWRVFVRCFTFNHAPYIIDAMNGFTMQQTTFPYVCCIVDDASTDGEPEVIRKYLRDNFDLEDKATVRNDETDDYVLCFAQHKINKNCYFAVLWLKYNHHGKKKKKPYFAEWIDNAKYVALCEGDDYWTSPSKLQKQVDYLEGHENCSLVFHNAYLEDASTGKRKGIHKIYNKSQYTPLAHIIRDGGFIPTSSIIYRKSMFAKYSEFPQKCPAGDIKIQTYAALVGKVYYINEIMSVYRLVPTSATHLVMKTAEGFVSHQNRIIDWYHEVNEYTNHGFEKDVQEAIVFSEARKIIALREYRKLWNPRYYRYIWNKPLTVRFGIIVAMCGLESLSRFGRLMLSK